MSLTPHSDTFLSHFTNQTGQTFPSLGVQSWQRHPPIGLLLAKGFTTQWDLIEIH